MADYDDSSVENDSYCMPSMNARNVDSMNQAMGYHNMADRANTPKPPVAMKAAKSNPQLGPKLGNPGRQGY